MTRVTSEIAFALRWNQRRRVARRTKCVPRAIPSMNQVCLFSFYLTSDTKGITLKEVLNSEIVSGKFIEFLQQERSVENYFFLWKVEKFQTEKRTEQKSAFLREKVKLRKKIFAFTFISFISFISLKAPKIASR